MIRKDVLARQVSRIVALTIFSSSIVACAPQLGLRLAVPSIPDPQRSIAVAPRGEPVRVRIGSFMDARKDDTIAVIDGREISTDGPPSATVQEGFERYLRDVGATIAPIDAAVIEGEISEWRVTITPGFPTTQATAIARIKVEVRDGGSRVAYRAGYSGEASSTHPFLREQGVRDLLAKAMGSAIEEAVNDQGLVGALSTTRGY